MQRLGVVPVQHGAREDEDERDGDEEDGEGAAAALETRLGGPGVEDRLGIHVEVVVVEDFEIERLWGVCRRCGWGRG